MIATLAVAAGVKHSETELTGRVALLGGRGKPAFSFNQVLCLTEATRILIAQPRLCSRVTDMCREGIPVSGLLRIL